MSRDRELSAELLRYEPRVISGFRPVLEPHLGLHRGLLRYILSEQHRHPGGNFCMIGDWHAMTMWFGRADLQEATLTTAAALLALGLNPYKTLLYAQSHVSGLGDMAWLLSCMTPETLLLRNHVPPSTALNTNNMGAIFYPVLMAANVLSLRGTKIAVSCDQIMNSRRVRQIGQAANRLLDNQVFPIPTVVVHRDLSGVNEFWLDVDIKERFADWKKRPDDLRDILIKGAQAASLEVKATLALLRERLGLSL